MTILARTQGPNAGCFNSIKMTHHLHSMEIEGLGRRMMRITSSLPKPKPYVRLGEKPRPQTTAAKSNKLNSRRPHTACHSSEVSASGQRRMAESATSITPLLEVHILNKLRNLPATHELLFERGDKTHKPLWPDVPQLLAQARAWLPRCRVEMLVTMRARVFELTLPATLSMRRCVARPQMVANATIPQFNSEVNVYADDGTIEYEMGPGDHSGVVSNDCEASWGPLWQMQRSKLV